MIRTLLSIIAALALAGAPQLMAQQSVSGNVTISGNVTLAVGSGGGTITVIDKATGQNAGSSSSVGTSTTINVATGDTLVVSCNSYDAPTSFTVSDTSSTNTFTASALGLIQNGNSKGWIEQFYVLQAVAKSGDTITCNLGGAATAAAVNVIHASGFSGTSAVDQTVSSLSSTSTSITSNSFTTTGAHELSVFDVMTQFGGNTFTQPAGYTLQNVDAGQQSADATDIYSSIQTGISVVFGWSVGSAGTLAGITIKQ